MSASKKKKSAASKKPSKSKVTKTKKAQKPAKVTKEATAEKPKKAAAPAKKETVEAEKKQAPKRTGPRPAPVKFGPLPWANVLARHIDTLHERAARGFSFGELRSAGVEMGVAKREGLAMDIRRRSVVEGNVELLKAWLKSATPAKKA